VKCVFCGATESRVVDSRPAEDGATIRRRRECEACQRRFTTYEKIEMAPMFVIKRNGTLQAFDPQRIRISILKACEKRTVPMEAVDNMVLSIEKQVYNAMTEQIESR